MSSSCSGYFKRLKHVKVFKNVLRLDFTKHVILSLKPVFYIQFICLVKTTLNTFIDFYNHFCSKSAIKKVFWDKTSYQGKGYS